MSKTYAIADLHGRFDLLEMALARITERADPPATVVTLGDYVDRGPDSRKIVERLMAGLGRDGWQLICLKGNHEDATLYTGTISIHMGRSSKRTGPTLTRLRGTPVGVFDDAAPGGPIEVFEVNGEPIEKILSSRRSISSLATRRPRRRGDRITTEIAAAQNVCFWHKADIPRLSSDVCFWG